eukprot:CAMPEP_0204526382 /NCGR_PEP_ID=MMETSP0661-20131031/8413_1 /ASSEMBLY_ACC=CAM_ASM_000606 /TAXON_ID=109239 /ORGANISM="Alexandrium margalefi, Strain AMGDE01CS-322" /LENGTH=41 /DNA_ID= /DNA_START= /DNA_END= /DNA_ORIENTATION=
MTRSRFPLEDADVSLSKLSRIVSCNSETVLMSEVSKPSSSA